MHNPTVMTSYRVHDPSVLTVYRIHNPTVLTSYRVLNPTVLTNLRLMYAYLYCFKHAMGLLKRFHIQLYYSRLHEQRRYHPLLLSRVAYNPITSQHVFNWDYMLNYLATVDEFNRITCTTMMSQYGFT